MQKHQLLFLQALCLLVLHDLADNINVPLTVRLIENAVCQKYFNPTGIGLDIVHESDCKIVEVQSRLAVVRGIFGLFQTLPGIFLGLIFAGLSDFWGRRLVYCIALGGIILQLGLFYTVCTLWKILPIELVWATSIFTLCGGGQFVIHGINISMVNDICPVEARSHYLFITFAARHLIELVTPFIAAQLMEHSLWLPALISATFLLMSYPTLIVMKEPLDLEEENTNPFELAYERRDLYPNTSLFRVDLRQLKHLLGDWRIIICLTINFLTHIRFSNFSVLITYVSTRFGWSISNVMRLLSIVPAGNLITFLILPATYKMMSNNLSAIQQYYTLTLVMIGLLAIGCGLIVFASSIPVLAIALAIHALGSMVVEPFTCLTTLYVDGTQANRLYTTLSMIDSLAQLIGEPLIQLSWTYALHIGGPWITLPFMITSACFVLAFFLCVILPVHSRDQVGSLDAELEDESRPLFG